MQKRTINTRDEAIEYAKEWQQWAGEQNLYMSELIEWQIIFEELATRFDLVDEFKENAII